MNDAIAIRVYDNDYMVPNKHHVMFIASGSTLVCTEVMWLNYMTIVRDLMLAGF